MRQDRIIDGFSKRRVLVIGDLIVDRYIWGKVDRISPEAPVPVVEVAREEFALGGAANVANNIVSLGGGATLVGICGQDAGGDTLKRLLQQARIECALVEDARPTSEKTRIIAHNQQVVRFDRESNAHLAGSGLRRMLEIVEGLLPSHDAVIISDYKKGVITPGLMKRLTTAAKKKYFVAVDPKVGHFHLYKGVSLITPNLNEASQGATIQITDERSLLSAGRKLVSSLRAGSVLITRGAEGMSLFAGRKVTHIPTAARKVYDVTGAGDTVIATFTLAHASGATLEQSAVLANYAAGIVVAQVGTAAATSKALKKVAQDHTDADA
ncbi:MAG: D-glycero-beta-D-manno-heptose-7-phosphate kinase [Nitrospiraceae bacterium]|nr:D-glycero-beta-D-manno-heptose-7-phosphate kinase [Nitrospiraceae bacterium]